jgi:hypothetical protein
MPRCSTPHQESVPPRWEGRFVLPPSLALQWISPAIALEIAHFREINLRARTKPLGLKMGTEGGSRSRTLATRSGCGRPSPDGHPSSVDVTQSDADGQPGASASVRRRDRPRADGRRDRRRGAVRCLHPPQGLTPLDAMTTPERLALEVLRAMPALDAMTTPALDLRPPKAGRIELLDSAMDRLSRNAQQWGGGAPDRAKMAEIMRLQGLTPAPPPPLV